MLCLLTALAFSQVPLTKPNVILILADDLGVNDLGCYGRKEHHTPNLDRLAAEGVRFTNAYSACPVCSPTRAALLTGKNPARLHLTTFLPGRPDAPSQKLLHPKIRMELPLEEITLAERLKPAGYATACIGKWHLGGKGFGPKEQGFDSAYAGKADTQPSETEGGKGEYDLTKHAEDFIAANKDRPFYLHLCHNNPHVKLGAKPELIAKHRDAFNPTYAAMIETLDDSVGRLLRKLNELKLSGKTIVAFTSDNGGLHVPEAGDPPTYNKPFRAGKGFLYEGGIRVPLIVRHPSHLSGPKEISSVVVSMDWTPTVMEWCGLNPVATRERLDRLEPDVELDGVSFASLSDGRSSKGRTLFWHFPHYTNQGSRPGGAVRDGNWKMVEHYEDGQLELFDLSKDPGETKDVASENRAVVARMGVELENWKQTIGAQANAPNPNFDADLQRRIYLEVDVSRFALPGANAKSAGQTLADWRRLMNEAVRKK